MRKHAPRIDLLVRAARGCGTLLVLVVLAGCERDDPRPRSSPTTEAATAVTGPDAASAGSRTDSGAAHASDRRGGDRAGVSHSDVDAGAPDPASPVEEDGATAAPPGADLSRRWTSYGYDFDNSQYNPHETLLSADNVAELKERWRIKFPGGATSTPTVYDGTVYFGGWDGRIYAADARTGELRWKTAVTVLTVRSTLLVTEERVFAAGFNDLYALDRADGRIVFSTRLHPHPLAMVESSPKLVDGLILIGVASLENATLQDDYTFIGRVVAVDAVTGEEVWHVDTTGDGSGPCVGGAGVGVWSSVAIDPDLGLAYIGTGQNYEEPAGTCEDSVLAIHYRREHQGERIAWVAQYTAGDIFLSVLPISGLDGDVGAAPNLFEAAGKPLVGAGDKPGSYRVFDRRTGALQWRVNLDHGDDTGIGGVMTTAAVHDDTIYVTSNHTAQSNLDLTLGELFGEEPFSGTEQSASDTSTLYALDTATGNERWHVALPTMTFGSFAIANGLLFHTIAGGKVYARDLATGKELWSADLGGSFGVGPSVIDGHLYVSNGMSLFPNNPQGGFVASFELTNGPSEPATVVDVGPADPPEPLSAAECEAALQARGNPACSACLCECNASAWGHCDLCWDLAVCPVLFCSLSAPEDDLRTCLEDSCGAKLMFPAVLSLMVDTAPCATKCNDVCGFL